MHELSIALNIIEIVEENARMHDLSSVSEVEIDIGTMSGVVPEVLEFSLNIAIKNTILEKARINFQIIPALARCNQCLKDFIPEDIYTQCPHCESIYFDIVKGRELQVKSIKVDDF